MAHVTVTYEMFLPGGHHRQPRNTSIDLDLAAAAGGDVVDGGKYTPPYFAQLPYSISNVGGMAQLQFWSVTDGTSGKVMPPSQFDQDVNGVPLTITAWYYPISGPAVPGPGSTSIIDDAFSANLGRFIDDTFLDVSPDDAGHSKTNEANITGDVATGVVETLTAKTTAPSTGEPFSEWILNGVVMPSGNAQLQVPTGTIGVAIAIYQQPQQSVQVGRPTVNGKQYETWQWVDYGTMVDGGPHPWNPMVNELMVGVALAAAARGVNEKLRGNLMKVAADQIKMSAERLQQTIQGAHQA